MRDDWSHTRVKRMHSSMHEDPITGDVPYGKSTDSLKSTDFISLESPKLIILSEFCPEYAQLSHPQRLRPRLYQADNIVHFLVS